MENKYTATEDTELYPFAIYRTGKFLTPKFEIGQMVWYNFKISTVLSIVYVIEANSFMYGLYLEDNCPYEDEIEEYYNA